MATVLSLRCIKNMFRSVKNTIKKYHRLANYISVAQIYLKDNFLLERPLRKEDIKPRLLGHWGTVPGQNFVYANINHLIKKYDLNMIFVSGPGHGFPGIQSNLWIEGTLSDFYSKIPRNKKGLEHIIQKFSWPHGFPSHAHPGAPGTILEGGELGYSLSTSFGAVMDNPDLMVTCVVGDGEAETGPLAASWQSIKYINPERDGVVLPVLHLNGYKISGPTVFGVMDDEEIRNYFKGLGYEPLFVDYYKCGGLLKQDIYGKMMDTLENAYRKIKLIKRTFKHKKQGRPAWPMIVLRTPKGWTGVDKVRNVQIDGTWRAHQVEVPYVKEDPYQLELLEKWLKSYQIEKLLDKSGCPLKEFDRIIPSKGKRMGDIKNAMCDARLNKKIKSFKSRVRKELKVPDLKKFEVKFRDKGCDENSSMRTAGGFLKEVYKLNAKNKNFRLFCPDETSSNKLDAVFDVTKRMMMWPFDEKNNPQMGSDGRVMEILSEHTAQGWLQGYLLTGRHGVFSSYESFTPIVSSMVDQYAKFLKQSKEFKWREPISSLNYILTSLGWRQDHNGFSHQNPGFISSLLEKYGDFVSIYLPVDSNSMLVALEDSLKRTNSINIIIAGKTPERQWLTLQEAQKQHREGYSIWEFMSDKNPDIVFASAGDYPTYEMLAGISLLRQEIPDIKLRYINISELTALGVGDERQDFSEDMFDKVFTTNKKVIFNFHGYPATIKKLLFDRKSYNRFTINGYSEEGSTTTPFDMLVRNGVSRYQIVLQALYEISESKPKLKRKCMTIIKKYAKKLEDHRKYIVKYGDDPDEIKNWKFECECR